MFAAQAFEVRDDSLSYPPTHIALLARALDPPGSGNAFSLVAAGCVRGLGPSRTFIDVHVIYHPGQLTDALCAARWW